LPKKGPGTGYRTIPEGCFYPLQCKVVDPATFIDPERGGTLSCRIAMP